MCKTFNHSITHSFLLYCHPEPVEGHSIIQSPIHSSSTVTLSLSKGIQSFNHPLIPPPLSPWACRRAFNHSITHSLPPPLSPWACRRAINNSITHSFFLYCHPEPVEGQSIIQSPTHSSSTVTLSLSKGIQSFNHPLIPPLLSPWACRRAFNHSITHSFLFYCHPEPVEGHPLLPPFPSQNKTR